MLFLRRTSPADRIALLLIVLYVLRRIAGLLGAPVPHALLFGFLCFAAIVYFAIRLIPWFRSRFLWSLRNRLVVAYVFMAVVPILLLVVMIGVATYLFYLQLGAHLLNDAVQQRANVIDTDAETIAAAIERQSTHATAPVEAGIAADPVIAGIIADEQREWPGMAVWVNRGQPLLALTDGKRYAGLMAYRDQLSFVAAQRRTVPAGEFTVLVVAPVTPEILDRFPQELGPIQMTLCVRRNRCAPRGFSLEIDGKQYVTSEQIASSRRVLPDFPNWSDPHMRGGATLDVLDVHELGKDTPGSRYSFRSGCDR